MRHCTARLFSRAFLLVEDMGHGVKLLLLFVWVCLLYTIGILVFTKGFLLKRVVIPDKSRCVNNTVKRSCSLPPTFSKAVLLVIDALRFDFAQYNESLEDNLTLPYQNKLTVLHELTTKSPQNGRLYKFIADPPTTTMQRLKGLTTGTWVPIDYKIINFFVVLLE